MLKSFLNKFFSSKEPQPTGTSPQIQSLLKSQPSFEATSNRTPQENLASGIFSNEDLISHLQSHFSHDLVPQPSQRELDLSPEVSSSTGNPNSIQSPISKTMASSQESFTEKNTENLISGHWLACHAVVEETSHQETTNRTFQNESLCLSQALTNRTFFSSQGPSSVYVVLSQENPLENLSARNTNQIWSVCPQDEVEAERYNPEHSPKA